MENLINQDGIEDNSEELEQYRWPSIVKELIKIYQNN